MTGVMRKGPSDILKNSHRFPTKTPVSLKIYEARRDIFDLIDIFIDFHFLTYSFRQNISKYNTENHFSF